MRAPHLPVSLAPVKHCIKPVMCGNSEDSRPLWLSVIGSAVTGFAGLPLVVSFPPVLIEKLFAWAVDDRCCNFRRF